MRHDGPNVCSERPAVIASMSARVGSIGDNNNVGGWYSYRASKTALNQLNKCMSIEFGRRKQPIACILLHPGTVDTGLSKPFQKVAPSMCCPPLPSFCNLAEIACRSSQLTCLMRNPIGF